MNQPSNIPGSNTTGNLPNYLNSYAVPYPAAADAKERRVALVAQIAGTILRSGEADGCAQAVQWALATLRASEEAVAKEAKP